MLSYLKRNGASSTFYAVQEHLEDIRQDRGYQPELARRAPETAAFANNFMISIIVPVYDPDMAYFRVMVSSVISQYYRNFELILADGGHTDEGCFGDIIKKDSRIVYRKVGTGGGISENTNAGLALASGDFVAFMDQDDFIEPDALYELVRVLQHGADMAYTDEDKFDTRTSRYMTPNRKPDFNRYLLLSNNYICHMFAVRREIAMKAGGLRPEFDGAQDFDFILRCAELTEASKIAHAERILYHWRMHEGSTSGNPESKMYAYDAGRRVIEEYLKRHGISGKVQSTEHMGFYRMIYTEKVESSDYKVLVDGKLRPLTSDFEKILSSYFADPAVGAVGARIISRSGRILCNGYYMKKSGIIESGYLGMNTHLSGYMHRAMLQQDVQAVSNHACVIRTELADCVERDSYKTCRKIRERGYTVVLDPAVLFQE